MGTLMRTMKGLNRPPMEEDNKVKRGINFLYQMMPYMMMAYMIFVVGTQFGVFAEEGATGAQGAFNGIFKAVTVITTVLGAIFLIVGVVRFVIAHANEDGPNQQKAAMMIATGVALIIIGPAMNLLGFQNLVQDGGLGSGGDGGGGGAYDSL